jgi:hypothetical protein
MQLHGKKVVPIHSYCTANHPQRHAQAWLTQEEPPSLETSVV